MIPKLPEMCGNVKTFEKNEFPKMQKIIKQAGFSRQTFETIKFAFMKIFDFSFKTGHFWAFLLFLGDLCHKLRLKIELGG